MQLLPFLLLATSLSEVLSLEQQQQPQPPLAPSPPSPPSPPGQQYKYENVATPSRIAAAHKKLAAEFSPSSFAAKNISLPRARARDDQGAEVYCDDQQGLGYWDFAYASQIVQTWCDGGGRAAPHTHVYADYGSVRVALCNFAVGGDEGGVSCSSGEINVAWAGIDEKCPVGRDALSRRGQWVQPDGKKGYSRDNCSNDNVCGSVFDVPCSGTSIPLGKDVA
ncbi:hypothetical protein F5X99DRAFT_407059 [Biscogniauxia marginata]|nr:hypothetical protein F5X99DRAFT_407059 [Biscogniauxia marginata]